MLSWWTGSFPVVSVCLLEELPGDHISNSHLLEGWEEGGEREKREGFGWVSVRVSVWEWVCACDSECLLGKRSLMDSVTIKTLCSFLSGLCNPISPLPLSLSPYPSPHIHMYFPALNPTPPRAPPSTSSCVTHQIHPLLPDPQWYLFPNFSFGFEQNINEVLFSIRSIWELFNKTMLIVWNRNQHLHVITSKNRLPN